MASTTDSSVLRSKDLFTLVTAFQAGWYADTRILLPLFSGKFSVVRQVGVEATEAVAPGGGLLCTSDESLRRFDKVWAPWYDTHHGLRGVRRLLRCRDSCRYVLYVHACCFGYVDVVMELVATWPMCTKMPRYLDLSAWNGQLHVVEYLQEHQYDECATTAVDWAARHGHLKIVMFLNGPVTPPEHCTTMAMDWAAEGGHLDVVTFLHHHRTEGCTTDAMDWAAQNGHLEVVVFLGTHRLEGCTTLAMDMAAQNGHLEVVQFLHDRYTHVGCTTDAIDLAAMHGHLAIVQFLTENRPEGGTVDALNWAAENGHLGVVTYLHPQVYDSHAVTVAMDGAIQAGQLDVVKYLYDFRVDPLNMWALAIARERRHRHVLEWLHWAMNPISHQVQPDGRGCI
ncbi:hypothetical protein H257_02317 [Aphanomyces astaci]|uniref:Uncharacterized protein n=1 Tax=Aphanomyces astaci TaxID=112090 RepID=W4H3I8_APHAT|nr:hypothetical protein H257_02317 [Aphanomyces astaci]ETV85718.1 hypothetical protein H257_02317 [Aphanomyces astaci]RQM10663.1 hypothetical protein B5M09_007064 [Aphanomyces astaci]|eukprot:XP_009824190.1 hypothetical protein H257_02317 [Aphanomyces astaci]